MKLGITFGEYSPLHQGHLDTILRAKKENDKCVVFVCGSDNDPRAVPLDLMKRYRIISNFLSEETVYVSYLNDTEMGLDSSMSMDNWRIWLANAYLKIKNLVDKVDECVWYVGEEEYMTPINKYTYDHKVSTVLLDRAENPISGTACRSKPQLNWNKITAPFRAYYSHNILIAGTASEGKTTLCRDIGKYFNLPYSYEKGRDLYQYAKTDKEFTAKDFIYNLYEQRKYNEELISSPQNPGVFISDSDNIVTLMYAKAYAGRDGFALTKEDYKVLYDIAKVYNSTTKWDKVFLIAPKPKPIVDDGQRFMEDSDFETRKAYFEILTSLYNDFNISYEILTGNYYENFCTIKNYINNLYVGE